MTSRAASRREHQRFCEVEGWQEVRNSRGKPTQHHITYELLLHDGSVLRTRISRPANTEVYGPGLWSHILDDQLHVTEAEFWECVDNRNPPLRARTTKEPDSPPLPAQLAYQLVHTLKLTSAQIAALTFEEAVRLMTEYWAQPPT
ncbi:MAG: cytotoxic translational repressor of toxin-antitoxin stability system [Acidobacteria bacterium]|nr:cytotoxic translational repressor of toxin-antitoxin stability system [Acidobacteriota bacterium]